MNAQDDENYELFRRAIVERDAEAWNTVYYRYRYLMLGWAHRANTRNDANLDYAELADQAFTRAWKALTPEHFANFRNLACILSYLRSCVASTLIDTLRQQANAGRQLTDTYVDRYGGPDQIVLDELERTELWNIALSVAATHAERVTLVESFAYGLPPRAIHARHHQLFASVADIYTTKRSLVEKLKRNQHLRHLYAERVH